ncbi:MAG: peptidase S41 [Brevundimonas sp.]|nr:MAG: peptidase S41 [Brevundimonas sp.]
MTFSPSRRALLVGAAGLAATSLAGPVVAQNLLSPDAMVEDVRLLRRAYETLHPGLLRYNTADQMAAAFDGLEADARAPMSLEAFYIRLSRFLATLKCGHSYANFYNQSRPVQQRLFETADRLPFQFVWLGDRMIVTRDLSGSGVVPGSEIVTLNSRPAGEVLAGLMTVARADGGNDAKRRQLMSVQAQDGYESFDVFYPLMFGSRSRHDLEIQAPDGRVRRAVVDAISLEARRAQRPPVVDAGGDTPVWSMQRRGDVAVLTMPGWGLYESAWDWKGWLNDQMDRVVADRVRRLVVDIRDNEGGLDCGDALAARLIDRPVVLDVARRLVRYRRIPEDLRPVLATWDRSFDDWADDAQPFDDRYFTLARSADEGAVIQPRGPRFTGDVVVLIGPQNSSATFGFAQMVKREGLARLVGETTGGNRRGINGGAFYFLRLPATGLEADLPLIGYFPPTPQPDAGIEPDVVIARTPGAIASGRDPVMEAVVG